MTDAEREAIIYAVTQTALASGYIEPVVEVFEVEDGFRAVVYSKRGPDDTEPPKFPNRLIAPVRAQ
jgi:hypothetical protein